MTMETTKYTIAVIKKSILKSMWEIIFFYLGRVVQYYKSDKLLLYQTGDVLSNVGSILFLTQSFASYNLVFEDFPEYMTLLNILPS